MDLGVLFTARTWTYGQELYVIQNNFQGFFYFIHRLLLEMEEIFRPKVSLSLTEFASTKLVRVSVTAPSYAVYSLLWW